jgi:hypothetical protein
MKMKSFIAVTFSIWLPLMVFAATPATTLTGTTVESVDEAKQTVSIKTKDGQSYALHVKDAELLKKYNLKKGDQISVQVDTDNNVIQIAKHDDSQTR